MTITESDGSKSKVMSEDTINSDSVNNANASVVTVTKSWSFYIGMDKVSRPFVKDVPPNELVPPTIPPVQMVVMKPCVCLGFNNLDVDANIPKETITKSGLSEEDIRAVMRDVSELLERKSSCCWKWGWLGPIMLVIWWLDMFLQQCHCGITLFLCQRPAMEEVKNVLREHNERLKGKCILSLLEGEVMTTSFSGTCTNKVYFDSWLIEFKGDLVAQV